MTTLLFPDNTVLINFTMIDAINVLGELLNTRGRWTVTIRQECEKSARQPGLESLARIIDLIGEPLIPNRAERVDTSALRAQLARPGDESTRHLGEAETFAVMRSRNLSAVFVTDDRDAARLAGSLGIPVYSTGHLLKLMVRARKVPVELAWQMVLTLRTASRHLPFVPVSEERFHAWCATA